MENIKTRNLGIMTLGFIIIGLISNIMKDSNILMALAAIMALIFSFIQRKENEARDFLIGSIFAALASLYVAIYLKDSMWIFVFASTYIGYVGAAPAFRTYLKKDKLVGDKAYKSIGLALGIGILLGLINILLGGMGLNFDFTIEKFLAALTPGIYEEVGLRFLFYGLGIYILKGAPVDKTQNILLYLLMIVPHLLGHAGISIVDFIMLSILFGLPMSIAQRKYDLTTAVIIHVVIDFIRFAGAGM